MERIDISGITPVETLFHNEKIKTFQKKIQFSEIKYWEGNLRTILAFEILENEKKKKLEELPIEVITNFLVSRNELHLVELANSIRKNGVRTPLIILDDGTLLDGNRRYFACSYLDSNPNKSEELKNILANIPVQIIKSNEVTEKQKNKILAEANYVDDLKVPWSLDVKAKVISDFFLSLIRTGYSEHYAYAEIKDVYSLDKADVKAYVGAIELTEEYINLAGKDEKRRFKLREQVLKKFVYFWEFWNKGLHGRGALEIDELREVKPLFFSMMENGFFINIRFVEAAVRSYRDKELWKILTESEGAKIDQVYAILLEEKSIKSAEDKVRNFLRWLIKQDSDKFTKATTSLLDQLTDNIKEIKNGK